LLTLLSLLDTA
jgi:hypothetical protein